MPTKETQQSGVSDPRPPMSVDGAVEEATEPAPAVLASSDSPGEPPAGNSAEHSSGGLISRWRHALVSFAITVVLLAVMGWQLDFEAVGAELKACDKTLVLLAFLSHYATYPVRGIRWRLSLSHVADENDRPTDVGSAHFGLMVFYYNFVDNVVPGMLGQIYAAHLARINVGVSRAAALGSIVFLRMIDSWVVLGAAGVSCWLLFSEHMPESVQRAITVGAVVAVVGSLILLVFYALHRLPSLRIPEKIRRRVDSFREGMWPSRRVLPAIAFLTLLVWTLESLWMLSLTASFGVHLSLVELLFLTMIPLLSSAFPLTPSGAGLVELTLFGCLRALSVGSVLAASITVLNRFIDYWLHILLGIVVWALRDRLGLRTWRVKEDEQAGPLDHLEESITTESPA